MHVASSPSCTVAFSAADIDGLLHTACSLLHPLMNVQPVQLVVQEMVESAVNFRVSLTNKTRNGDKGINFAPNIILQT